MIPRLLSRLLYSLILAGLIVLSFWLIGFFMPFYWTSAVLEINVRADEAMHAWTDLSQMTIWSDRFRRVIQADSAQVVAEDSAGTVERWSVVERIAPDSLIVSIDRKDYHMINFFRFEFRDSNRTTVRRWVRMYPHGAWFDSWFFFVKSRYVAQIQHENERFVRQVSSPSMP